MEDYASRMMEDEGVYLEVMVADEGFFKKINIFPIKYIRIY